MFYVLARFIMGVGLHLLYRIKVTGAEHVPAEGGFIICANHIHELDPVLLAICVKRLLRFMAKKELFEHWFTGIFLRWLGAFPVNRDAADMRSYKKAVEIINEGNGLLIFSQGHRMKEFVNAKSGVALFALKTNAPIIPVGIAGTYGFRKTLRVTIGKPITTEAFAGRKVNTQTVSELMTVVVETIKELTV